MTHPRNTDISHRDTKQCGHLFLAPLSCSCWRLVVPCCISASLPSAPVTWRFAPAPSPCWPQHRSQTFARWMRLPSPLARIHWRWGRDNQEVVWKKYPCMHAKTASTAVVVVAGSQTGCSGHVCLLVMSLARICNRRSSGCHFSDILGRTWWRFGFSKMGRGLYFEAPCKAISRFARIKNNDYYYCTVKV